MKLLESLVVATLSATLLVACGGSSDSSGDETNASNAQHGKTTESKKPTEPKKPEQPKAPETSKCKMDNKNIYVPKDSSCSISIPNLNKGAMTAFQCAGGIVSSNGMIARTIELKDNKDNKDYIIQCEK